MIHEHDEWDDWEQQESDALSAEEDAEKIAVLEAEVKRMREALEIYEKMPLGHYHFDSRGTSGLNCQLCNEQKMARDIARAALGKGEA